MTSEAPAPYPEDDKLGPVPGAGRLGADLRATLVDAFRAAIADAQAAAPLPSIDEAVHELRKALRRARATADLVARTLSRDDRKDLRKALAAARQLLSATRDLAVAPGALATVPLDDAARATANDVLTRAKSDAPGDDVRALLTDAAGRVAPLADVMAAALPSELDWADLSDGLAATYRRARRGLRRGKRSREAFHEFRKRTKELTYQLELLAGGVDAEVEALRRPLLELGDSLGATVDVLMLRGFLEDHAGDTPPEALAPVLAEIDADLSQRIKAARKQAQPLFERRARRFARKARKAARRDHAAPPPASAAQA